MHVKRRLLIATLLLGSASVARAEPLALPGSPNAAGQAAVQTRKLISYIKLGDIGPGSGDAGEAVDLTALRYYVGHKDIARANAEIRLLRNKYPKWHPATNIFEAFRNEELEQPLWDLFDKHDFAGVRDQIKAMQAAKPEWYPSVSLLTKVSLGEARDRLLQASDNQAWSDVVNIATSNNGLMTLADLDVIWRTAEALAHVGDQEQTMAFYRYVLQHDTVAAERLATVQKASLLVKPSDFDDLLALAKRGPDGRDEFEEVRLDLVRRKIGLAAAGSATDKPTATEIDAVAQAFERQQNTGDAQLLGWYAYSEKDMLRAENWFKKAMAVKVEAKSAEGLVLALRDEGKQDEAQALAFKSRDLDVLNREEMIALHSAAILGPKAARVPKETVLALAQAIETDKSADGAQAFGWYRYRLNDPATAQSWFRKAASWKESEPAAIGLLVCANRLKQSAEFAKLARTYRAKYTRVAQLESLMRPRAPAASAPAPHKGMLHEARDRSRRKLPGGTRSGDGWDRSADEIVKTFQGGEYDKAVALLEQRKQLKAETKGLAMVHGWALFHQGDWVGARKVFNAAGADGQSPEVRTAIRVIDEAETPAIRR